MRNLLLLTLFYSLSIFSQTDDNHRQILIDFPNVDGYELLKCDLHMHTVFSDGEVWPTIRIKEALKDGLDVVSITDHLEYQPHSEDIPHPDRNRSFEIASKQAEESGLFVINGSEITRQMPPGHSNAIFISDANKLLDEDPIEVFKEARTQDAFVFWNHPNWPVQKPDGMAELTEMHKQLIDENLVQGIEVVNGPNYSDEAFQIALDNNLTLIGTSDVHGLIDWDYHQSEDMHRPVTLVFAKTRSAEAVKEALFDRRTVVVYHNNLIGREDQLLPLLTESIVAGKAHYAKNTNVLILEIENKSSLNYTLRNASAYTLNSGTSLINLKPYEKVLIEVKTIDKLTQVLFQFEVLNAVTSPGKFPIVKMNISPETITL